MKTNRTHNLLESCVIRKLLLQVAGVLLAGVLLTACREENPAKTGSAFAGVYQLDSVNGKKVPTTISHDNVNLEIRSGTFTIKADGTCGTKTVFVPPKGLEVSREVNATYTGSAAKLKMKWEGAGITYATVDGNTLTMNNEGMVLLYKK